MANANLERQFVRIVCEWMEHEFCESLLINNALKNRTHSDYENRDSLIQEINSNRKVIIHFRFSI